MRLMRAVTAEAAKVVEVADTCWPTIGTEPGVERHEERLDLSALRVRIATEGEHVRVDEIEDAVDAAVVQKAEAAHLIAEEAGGRGLRAGRDSERAYLLVEVPEVGDLELLRLPLERRESVGADRQLVAERALEYAAIDRRVEEDVLAGRLRRVQAAVEVRPVAGRHLGPRG